MFLDFFLLLKQHGLPVTLKEHLVLLEALEKGLGGMRVESFYYLARTILIKREKHLDKFDMLFSHYFRGMDLIPDEVFTDIPEEWLRKNLELFLGPEEMAQIEALGGLEALMERFKELMAEQKERHEGGNKWIGTGGRSPFGAYGYNPEGFRIGQEGSRHRRAVKVWDQRMFRNLADDVELNTRNMKMALRHLRVFTREGIADELDLETTIRKTSENAGLLELEMVPARQNRVKVLLFLDVGGSMDDHIRTCEELFSAAKYEFKHLEYYYFHNCLYESVWQDNYRRFSERIPT
ncbi:MAG: VWA domain-containing protein, partial [Bacteroidota bacterium]